MTKEERKRFIVTQIRAGEKVYITSLSQDLGVSDDTLRRDLIELDSEGVLMRVHGGAVARTAHSHQYTDRIHLNSTQKQRLASKVIPLLRPHDVIILDGGTTNVEVARQLPRNLPLTIYTNSFPIVNELMHFAHIELVFLGGTVFPKSEVTVGIPVFQALQSVRAHWLILGICNVHPKIGLSGPDREESLLKRCMIERAENVIVIADNGKLNTAENYLVCTLHEIDYLVVETEKKQEIQAEWGEFKFGVL